MWSNMKTIAIVQSSIKTVPKGSNMNEDGPLGWEDNYHFLGDSSQRKLQSKGTPKNEKGLHCRDWNGKI